MLTTNVPKTLWSRGCIHCKLHSRVLNYQNHSQNLLQLYPNTQIMSMQPPKIFRHVAFVHIYHRGKLDPRPLNAYSSAISQQKGDTNVIHQFQKTQQNHGCYILWNATQNTIQGETQSTQEWDCWLPEPESNIHENRIAPILAIPPIIHALPSPQPETTTEQKTTSKQNLTQKPILKYPKILLLNLNLGTLLNLLSRRSLCALQKEEESRGKVLYIPQAKLHIQYKSR